MPKKIKQNPKKKPEPKKKPIKTATKKKPIKTATVRTPKDNKKKPVIAIIQQKLPKEKCCTDPIKSGQAYTIPIGFTHRLGLMPQEVAKPVAHVEQVVTKTIGTSTEPVITNTIGTSTKQPPKRVKLPKKSIVSKPKYTHLEEPVNASIENIENIETIPSNLGFETGSYEETTSPKPKRSYIKRKETPRKNSMDDLRLRYRELRGEEYIGNPKRLREVVELMEQDIKKNPF